MSNPLHVIIAGAGLAGPALAIALAKHSIKSTIIERRPFMQDIGGVIMLAPNAMRVMDELLEVGDRLRAAGDMFKAINIYTKGSGSAKLDHVGGFTVEDEGILGLTIARPVLHQELLKKCEEMSDRITIRYSSELESIKEDSDGCEAVLKGGSTVQGSIIVGADGIRSKVRQHLLGKDDITPLYCGYTSIGCIMPRVDAGLPAGMALPAFLYTPSGTFLVFAMDGAGEKIQWVTSFNIPERDRRHGWDELRTSGETLEIIKTEYQGVTAAPIRSLVNHLNNDNLRLWAPYTVPAIPRWHGDRLCLVGDASHAISPAVGQGSAQALKISAYSLD